MSHICAFVSERHGIHCQLTRNQHRIWGGWHMAWINGVPALKTPGEFVPESPDARGTDE